MNLNWLYSCLCYETRFQKHEVFLAKLLGGLREQNASLACAHNVTSQIMLNLKAISKALGTLQFRTGALPNNDGFCVGIAIFIFHISPCVDLLFCILYYQEFCITRIHDFSLFLFFRLLLLNRNPCDLDKLLFIT